MRRHHLFAVLRRAVASAASHRAPLPQLHSVALRNGAAGSFSPCFFSSRARSSAGAAKSLMEDEAELSDWISDLKTDSFHLGLSSGDEGDAPSTRRPSIGASSGARGGRGRDSRGSFLRSRMAGGDFSGDRRGGFERRGRVMSSDLDDGDDDSGFGSSRGRRGRGERSSGFVRRGGSGNGFDEVTFRSPRGQRSQRGRGSGAARRGGRYGDFDRHDGDRDTGFGSSRGRRGGSGQLRRGRVSDLDDDEDSGDDLVGFGDSGRKQHHDRRRGGREDTVGMRRGRGRRDLGPSRKGGNYSDLGDYDGDIGLGSSRGRQDRGGRMSGLSKRRGRASDLDDDEDEDEDDDTGLVGFEGSRVRQQGGSRGEREKSVGPRRGGRGSDMDFGRRQPRGAKKIGFGLSEDDDEAGEVDEDDEPSGFEDDLSDDEGVKEDVGEIKGNTNKYGSSMSAEDEPAKHESVQGRRSTGGGDSYLSQKR